MINIQTEAGRIVTGATKSASASKILRETGWETLGHRRYTHRFIIIRLGLNVALTHIWVISGQRNQGKRRGTENEAERGERQEEDSDN